MIKSQHTHSLSQFSSSQAIISPQLTPSQKQYVLSSPSASASPRRTVLDYGRIRSETARQRTVVTVGGGCDLGGANSDRPGRPISQGSGHQSRSEGHRRFSRNGHPNRAEGRPLGVSPGRRGRSRPRGRIRSPRNGILVDHRRRSSGPAPAGRTAA